MSTNVRAVLGAAAILATLIVPASARAQATGTFETKTIQGRSCKIYTPTKPLGPKAPLVVLLHGCTQDGDTFARGTRMNELAEKRGWLVLYPEQPSSANQNKCWNWYLPEHQQRGRGEPANLAAIVDQVIQDKNADPERVYVAGLSAGAAMSVILGATYPDRFAAIGVCAGLEYGSATDVVSALSAMRQGGPSPQKCGDSAWSAMGPAARSVPAMIFHGASDHTVAPLNGEQIAAQWIRTDDLAPDGKPHGNLSTTPSRTTHGTAAGGLTYTVFEHADASGEVVVTRVLVDGMDHAWSGGDSAGTYTEPRGPSATEMLADFFQANPRTGAVSVTPPVVTPPVVTPPVVTPPVVTPPAPVATTTPCACSGPTKTLVLVSSAAEDGFAGKLAAARGVPMLGDNGPAGGDAWRAILSFDTSTLPAGARIVSVKLQVCRMWATGALGSLVVDVNEGPLGAGSGVDKADFAASATVESAASFTPPPTNGAWSEADLPPATYGSLSSGLVQVRLREGPARGQTPNMMGFYGGSDALRRPQLIVTYVP